MPDREVIVSVTPHRSFTLFFIAFAAAIVGGMSTAGLRAAPYYWDANGSSPGSGDTGGSWSGSNWTTSSAGTVAAGPWVTGSDAVFSAGSDGTGAINVTLPTPETLHNLTVSAGSVALSGGGLTLSSLTTSATWTVNPGATLNVQSAIDANGNVLTVNNYGSTTFGGGITTTRGVSLTGSGTVVLAANNPLSGGVGVQAAR